MEGFQFRIVQSIKEPLSIIIILLSNLERHSHSRPLMPKYMTVKKPYSYIIGLDSQNDISPPWYMHCVL